MAKGDLKYALQLAGSEHRYQKLVVLLISLSWILYNFVLLGSTLIYMNPVFTCDSKPGQKVFEAEACAMPEQCSIIDKFTLTAQLNLYCELQWARNLIQSIFSAGALIGLLIMNILSDTKGRKLSTLICLSIMIFGIIMNLIGGWTKQIWLIVISQFLTGFGTSSLVSLSYALLSDYCNQRFKPRAVIFVNSAWSFSTVLIGVFYLVQLNWGDFLLYIILIPLILVSILIYFCLFESPYILMNQNKKQETLEVLIKVAKFNQMHQNIDKIEQIVNKEEQRHAQNKASIRNVWKILKKKVYLVPLCGLSFIRIFGSLNFYGSSYAFDTQGLGLGYNSMLAGFMELLAFLFLTFFVNKIPRRKGIAGFYILAMIIGLCFFFSFVKDNEILATSMMGMFRIVSTISYTLIASMQTQAFTVQIQSTAVGLIESFGLLGAILGPLIVSLADKIGVSPLALIGIFVNFAIWPTIFMKETLNNYLEQDGQDPLIAKTSDSKVDIAEQQTRFGSRSTILSDDQV